MKKSDLRSARKLSEAILWIRCMLRIGNHPAAQRYERELLALIVAFLLVACSGETFRGLPIIVPDGAAPIEDAGDELELEASVDAGGDIQESGIDAPPIDAAPDTSKPDAKPTCTDPNDVEYGGHCFYLDGSKGVCDQGYTLSTNAKLAAVLAANANAWQGKNYRHNVSDNSCVLTKDNVENYGMTFHANLPGPFSAGEPVANGGSCWMISPPLMQPKQLTLCESL